MSKRKVAIITDASSDLPPELVEKHKITILPILINFESKSYKVEGIEKGITWDEYYSLVDEEIPTTAIPGPGVFLKAFEEALSIFALNTCLAPSHALTLSIFSRSLKRPSSLMCPANSAKVEMRPHVEAAEVLASSLIRSK